MDIDFEYKGATIMVYQKVCLSSLFQNVEHEFREIPLKFKVTCSNKVDVAQLWKKELYKNEKYYIQNGAPVSRNWSNMLKK